MTATTTTPPIDVRSRLDGGDQSGPDEFTPSPIHGSHVDDGQQLSRFWFAGCEGFTVVSRKTSQSSWVTEAYPVHGSDEAIADAAGYGANFDTYVRASTVATAPKRKKRGTSADTLHVPGFMFDLDGAWGTHAAADPSSYPATPEEALEILEGFPPPSAIIWSGGGLYPMWKLNEPLQGDADAGPLLKLFQSHWERRFGERGWHLDDTSDTARVFRWPGTVNRKGDGRRTVALLDFSGLVYDLDDILAVLDPLPPPEPKPAPLQIERTPASVDKGSPFEAIRCLDGQRFVADVLIDHGWQEGSGHANGGIDLTRPVNDKHGEQSSGLSLRIGGKHPTTGDDMTGQAYMFTSGAVDPNGQTIESGAYSLADTLAETIYAGDRGAAARFLLDNGWGERPGDRSRLDGDRPVTVAAEGTAPPDADRDEQLTSWRPLDLTAALNGEGPPAPAVWRHRRGHCLLYAGRTHAFFGASETLKSWAAQAAVAEVLIDGGDVLYIDYEDDQAGVGARLRALGVPREAILEHLVYLRPDEPLMDRRDTYTRGGLDFHELLSSRVWRLSVIDGMTEAMTTEGLEVNDNADSARFQRRLMRPIAETGAATVAIDHQAKNVEAGKRFAIGAQHKLSGLTGAAYQFESQRPLGRPEGTKESIGLTKITVSKDRPGFVRGQAKNGTAGILQVTSWPDYAVDVEIVDPADLGDAGADMELAGRILSYLVTYDGASKNKLEEDVTGKRDGIRAALAWMVGKRWIEVRKEGQSHRHYLMEAGRREVPE